MLNIFFGRENLHKEKFIFDRLNLDEKNILIVPDQFTLEAERDLFSYLDIECLMDTEVISLSRLGHKLLEECGGDKRAFIDKYGRHMLLSKIVRDNSKKLDAFKGLENKNSFIELANNFISELKQSNVKADSLDEVLKSFDENSYSYKKLSDLKLIFSNYEKEIEGKYTDSEDKIDLYLSKVSKSKYIKDSNIYIYGFDSLAPKAMLLIGELLIYAKDVNVVLTYDYNDELFLLTKIVIENLEELARKRGIECNKEKISLDYDVKERKEAIKVIEKELFKVKPKKASDNSGVTLINAASIYNEAETVSAYTLSLIRDKGYRLSDIKIICNDQDKRTPILKRMFSEYGLPLFSDEGVTISDTALVQYVYSLIDTISTNFYSDSVLRLIKSGFTDLSFKEAMELENYALKYRIKGTKWKNTFEKGEKDQSINLSRVEQFRKVVINPLLKFEEICKDCKKKTNRDFIDALYIFLKDDLELSRKVEAIIDKQHENKRYDLADETEQIFKYMVQVLEQMKEIIGEDKFKIDEFLELFMIGLKEVAVGALPPTKDGIILGTMERTRIGSNKVLIIFGANEGVLPLNNTNDTILNKEEREILKEKGFDILRTENISKMEEDLAIYRNISKPTDEIIITKSLSDEEGKKLNPSIVYEKILSIFGDSVEKEDILNSSDTRLLINPSLAGLRHLTKALKNVDKGNLPKEWNEVLDWYKINDNHKLDSIKRGFEFTNVIENIPPDKAKLIYGKGKDEISFGPTSIENYTRCPFKFFLMKGLSLEEKKVYEASNLEIGDFSHLVVEEFSKRMHEEGIEPTNENSKWMTISEDDIKSLVDNIVDEKVKEYKEELFSFSNAEIYQATRMKNTLYKVCSILCYQVRKGIIKEIFFEEEFRRNKKFEPITIDTKNGKVYIEGKIDRVDILQNDRVKIIDYKTGDNKFDIDEAKSGYQIQLMLYLKAAEENVKKPGAVFYFHIKEPFVNLNNKPIDEDSIKKELRKEFKLNGAIVDDENVIKSMETDFKEKSDIIPLEKTKTGYSARSIVLTDEEFTELENEVMKSIKDALERLTSGDIRIYPSKMKKDGKKNACSYCNYYGICRFDRDIPGSEYREI